MIDKNGSIIVPAKSSKIRWHSLGPGITEEREPRSAGMRKPEETQAELSTNGVDRDRFL